VTAQRSRRAERSSAYRVGGGRCYHPAVPDPSDASLSEETLADSGDGSLGRADVDTQLEPGSAVGRYVVLETIGAGGMGVVYAAFDPELDRRVALKRMRADRSAAESLSDGRSRLLREAQAMAKLSHPNVVAVHDVGVHAGRVFLAMEHVDGETLGAWMKRGPHGWEAVTEVFVGAGRGLSAAHDAGLVHRDFKPENVLLHPSGLPKVTDFGLARKGPPSPRGAAAAPTAPNRVVDEGERAAPRDPSASYELSMTAAGSMMGTPAYMSPEQHLGLPADARSDQFSFCIAYYEALYGERPFAGSGAAALAIAVTEGAVRDPPAGTRVPGWVRQVVLRGLAPEAGERFPSMAALLDALSRDPQAARRRMLGLALGGVMVAATGYAVAAVDSDRAPVCAGVEHHLDGLWDDAARAQMRDGLDRSGVGFAESTASRVVDAVDAYSAAWVSQRREACEATQVRGEQSQSLMDRRMLCLDERLSAVRSLVTLLSEADVAAAQNAVTAAGDLPDLTACSAASIASAGAVEVPVELAARVAEHRAALADARVRGTAAHYESGLALASATAEATESLGFQPVYAEALFRRGSLEHQTGADEQALESLEQAYFLAIRHATHPLAARAAAELTALVGGSAAKTDHGRMWAKHALTHAELSEQPLLVALATHELAGVAHTAGEFDEARTLAARALELRTETSGPDHASVLGSLNLLGRIASDTGKYDEARALFERGLERGRVILGEDHPDLARFMNNMAKIAWSQGKLDEAGEAFERALALQVAALGPDHRNVAQLHNNLAAVAASRGDMEEAGRRFRLALGIWERALGAEHPSIADALNNLAVVASGLGRFEEARGYDERALEIRKRTMPEDHPAVAQAYNNLGEDLRNLGDAAGALPMHEEALRIFENKLGPKHDDVALTLTSVGEDLFRLGRFGDALPHLERALEIRAPLEIDPVERAHTKAALGRVLWALPAGQGRDRARAMTLVDEAIAAYEAGGEERELERHRAWRAKR
jgi:tetratricopeptide (TPR) repeat protein